MTTEPITHPSTAHALGCGMNNGRPVIACICGLPNKPCPEGTVGGGPGECCNTLARFPLDLPPEPEWCMDEGAWAYALEVLAHARQLAEIAQAQAEALINDLLEAVVPYRENTDGTTSSTIPDHIIDRINAMFPRKP